MIHPTPIEVKNSENLRIKLKERFKEYENTFVILNPFLKLKPNVKSTEDRNLKTLLKKSEFLKIVEKYSWNNFKKDYSQNNLEDISNLIHNHWKSDAWVNSKLDMLTQNINLAYPSQGHISELNENLILQSIRNLGYEKVTYESLDTNEVTLDIEEFILENNRFSTAPLIKTLDEKIKIYQPPDSITTFISSSRINLEEICRTASLEGFFANEQSTILWGSK